MGEYQQQIILQENYKIPNFCNMNALYKGEKLQQNIYIQKIEHIGIDRSKRGS